MTRPARCNIFPQLEKLIIDGNFPEHWFRYSILFLPKSIPFLSLREPDCDDTLKYLRPLLNKILYYSPALTRLEFSTDCAVRQIEDDLCLLLSGLTHLETLYLAPCMLTTPVLHSIALLPNLSKVGMLSQKYGVVSSWDITHFEPPDFDNAFASLNDLAMQGRFVTITEFFLFKRFPFKLRTLSINIVRHDPFPDLRLCLEAIANSCPGLKKLEIILSTSLRTPETCRADPITAHTLSPLEYFASLETFELEFYEPVDMTDVELISIVKACPSLQGLCLNSLPLSLGPTSLTLQFLELLSKEPAAEKLEHLEIYLDASTISNSPEFGRCTDNMRTVSFGASRVSRFDNNFLFYLSRLFTSECKLVVDPTDGPKARAVITHDSRVSQRVSTWQKVEEFLLLLTRIRQDERELVRKRAEVQSQVHAPVYMH